MYSNPLRLLLVKNRRLASLFVPVNEDLDEKHSANFKDEPVCIV